MKKYDEAEAVYNAGLVAVPGDATLSAALKEVRLLSSLERRVVCFHDANDYPKPYQERAHKSVLKTTLLPLHSVIFVSSCL